MEFPTTQIGFEQMFSTEEACLAYFVNLKFKVVTNAVHVVMKSIG